MNQKPFRLLFTSTLAAALLIGVLTLTNSTAFADWEPACPTQMCTSTVGLSVVGWCNYYDEATDCLSRCFKYEVSGGSQTVTGGLMPVTSYCFANCEFL